MLHIFPIKKSTEFQKIGKKGEKFYSKTTILLSLPTPSLYLQDLAKGKRAKNFCRVGFTVSKTVGGAVIRNRAKRRLRAAVRALFPLFAKNYRDYVIIARKEISSADFAKISDDLKFCLTRIHTAKNHLRDQKNEKPNPLFSTKQS